MPIDIVNVLITSFSTGIITAIYGWAGFVGSMIGNVLYFFLIKEFLF